MKNLKIWEPLPSSSSRLRGSSSGRSLSGKKSEIVSSFGVRARAESGPAAGGRREACARALLELMAAGSRLWGGAERLFYFRGPPVNCMAEARKRSRAEQVVVPVASTLRSDDNMPMKRMFRQRAHCNPLSHHDSFV